MKKLLSLLTILALCSSMVAGCGKKDDAKDTGSKTKTEEKTAKKEATPEDTIDALMDDLFGYEWDNLGDYFEDETAADELTSEVAGVTESFEELEELGIDTEVFDDLMKKILSTMDYEITNSEIDGDTATVECVLISPDFESIDVSDEEVMMDILGVSDEMELMEKYLDMNEEELTEFAETATEEELTELMLDMYAEMIPDLADGMVELAEDSDKIEEEATFTLEKVDDEWLITEAN